MSSEQVIAALREYADLQDMVSASGGTFPVRLNGAYSSESLRSMADRLSTPAAGGDAFTDDVRRLINGLPDVARNLEAEGQSSRAEVVADACRAIRQLQARNAEQAAEVERWQKVYAGIVVSIVQAGVPAFGTAEEGVEKLGAKLSALLDGIEGLEAKFRAVGDGSTFTSISMAIAADDLKALREKANG